MILRIKRPPTCLPIFDRLFNFEPCWDTHVFHWKRTFYVRREVDYFLSLAEADGYDVGQLRAVLEVIDTGARSAAALGRYFGLTDGGFTTRVRTRWQRVKRHCEFVLVQERLFPGPGTGELVNLIDGYGGKSWEFLRHG
jgi:hypothetical protein